MLARLRDWLVDPAVRGLAVDETDFSVAHREALLRKPILQDLFLSFYQKCRNADERFFGDCPGRRVEIGSGSSLIKGIFPETITSDIKPLPFVDMVFRAEAMPFAARSLRSVYAINVLHHLPDPRRFFRELLRVLHPGGGAVIVEPYHGPLARWLFRRLHRSERFDPEAPTWEAAEEVGPFSNVNQALSYVIFERDRALFDREFPELELVADTAHTHVWYLASGGVNFRQLVPNRLTPFVRMTEGLLRPLNSWIALQHTVVLRKRV